MSISTVGDMGWTTERVETLKKLWLVDGMSASQVARQLGGITRSAVIGKVHRLGLTGRATPSHPNKFPRRPTTATRTKVYGIPARARSATPEPRKHEVTATTPPASYVELSGTATIFTLGAHMCKWPIGDPGANDFTFCGRRMMDGGPYCIDHARLAYRPPQERRTSAAEFIRGCRRYI